MICVSYVRFTCARPCKLGHLMPNIGPTDLWCDVACWWWIEAASDQRLACCILEGHKKKKLQQRMEIMRRTEFQTNVWKACWIQAHEENIIHSDDDVWGFGLVRVVGLYNVSFVLDWHPPWCPHSSVRANLGQICSSSLQQCALRIFEVRLQWLQSGFGF